MYCRRKNEWINKYTHKLMNDSRRSQVLANSKKQFNKFSQEQKGGRLSQFARYVRQFGGGLQQVIEDAKDGATIFAPSNEAFDPAIRYKSFTHYLTRIYIIVMVDDLRLIFCSS